VHTYIYIYTYIHTYIHIRQQAKSAVRMTVTREPFDNSLTPLDPEVTIASSVFRIVLAERGVTFVRSITVTLPVLKSFFDWWEPNHFPKCCFMCVYVCVCVTFVRSITVTLPVLKSFFDWWVGAHSLWWHVYVYVCVTFVRSITVTLPVLKSFFDWWVLVYFGVMSMCMYVSHK
jgi:hypothetical protein